MILCRALSYEENTLDKSRLKKVGSWRKCFQAVPVCAALWPLSAGIDPYNGLLPRDTAQAQQMLRHLRCQPPPLGSSYYFSFRCSSIQCSISLRRLMRLEGFPSRLRPWFSP